jgi:hypothetical protein
MPKPKAVAVVAVHGVADQKPAESARAIADLLCHDEAYSSFSEVPLRISRARLEPGEDPDVEAKRLGDAARQPQQSPAGLQYMYEQLADYPGSHAGAVYESVRLEGRNIRSQTPVHVYELYWADLSRAGDTWYRLVSEVYQLILHLPSLGRNALQYAARATGKPPFQKQEEWVYTRPWSVALLLQTFAVWLLTVPAALLNLVLFSLILVVASAEIPAQYQKPAALLAGTLILAVIPLALVRKHASAPLVWRWWLPIVTIAATVATLLVRGRNLHLALAIEAMLVAAGACIYIANAYNRMKSGALAFGIAASIVTAGVTIYFLLRANASNEADVYLATVDAGRFLYPSIQIAWGFIFLTATVAAIAGFAAVRKTPQEQRSAARAAAWTARFSLGMPAALFVLFTLAIWDLLVEAIGRFAPIQSPHAQLVAMLMESARGLELFTFALLAFVVTVLVAAGPSIVAELRHPSASTDAESEQLGQWLSRGILWIAAVAELFTVVLVLVPLVAKIPLLQKADVWRGPLLSATAALVALLLTSKYFIGTFRAAVDVVLDIDNYMRESPDASTPRARIAERYVSLLRHLCEWRDADGQSYDRIVIVAHSQGTVISADVLRYLNARPDPKLRQINDDNDPQHIPLRLFTMGSPLRQIYGRAFPHLYGWITDPNATAVMTAPDPTALTLQQWANTYRSGDYVGRNIWTREPTAHLWTRGTAEPQSVNGRTDFCCGAGAHTHYWNENGGEVAAYLKTMLV